MKLLIILLILYCGFVHIQCFMFGSSRCQRGASLKMKIYDWKNRELWNMRDVPFSPEDYELSVTSLFPSPGSRKRPRRVGRGISAGQGASCGKGMRGQNSRKGGGTRPGFEGGQTPLYRRIPKFPRPMRGHPKRVYELIKLEHLNSFCSNSTVNVSDLITNKVISKPNKRRKLFKVIGGSVLSMSGLQVRAHAFTASARIAIEASGGKAIVLSETKDIPLEEAIAIKLARNEKQLERLSALRLIKKEGCVTYAKKRTIKSDNSE